jgi:hypothetical protein
MVANIGRIASNAHFDKARARRLADLVVACANILAMAWPMLLVALLIRCESRGPVCFVLPRPTVLRDTALQVEDCKEVEDGRGRWDGCGFEALEPIRQGVRERFGAVDKSLASGLTLRHDHGSNM